MMLKYFTSTPFLISPLPETFAASVSLNQKRRTMNSFTASRRTRRTMFM